MRGKRDKRDLNMNKNVVNSYIVRIYRGNKYKPHRVFGIVEEVGAEDKKAFTNCEELWEIMKPVTAGKEDPKKTIRAYGRRHNRPRGRK